MIFSVRRPRYFISHTKSLRFLVTRHHSLVRKLICMHSYGELGTPVLGDAILDLAKKKSAQADGKATDKS